MSAQSSPVKKAKADTPNKGEPKPLTANENRILCLAWQCMTTQPQVDIEKLAPLANLKPESARTIFNGIKRKLVALGAVAVAAATSAKENKGGNEDDAATKPPGTPVKKVEAGTDAENGDGETKAGAESTGTPKKAGRKRKVKTEDASSDANGACANANGTNGTQAPGDGSPAPKKRGRKSKAEKEREAAVAAATTVAAVANTTAALNATVSAQTVLHETDSKPNGVMNDDSDMNGIETGLAPSYLDSVDGDALMREVTVKMDNDANGMDGNGGLGGYELLMEH